MDNRIQGAEDRDLFYLLSTFGGAQWEMMFWGNLSGNSKACLRPNWPKRVYITWGNKMGMGPTF